MIEQGSAVAAMALGASPKPTLGGVDVKPLGMGAQLYPPHYIWAMREAARCFSVQVHGKTTQPRRALFRL